ncbi:MAG: diaminopimelate decarboxylase [SAR202 cluster bacterium]|nr:diaminopimelate decarboxylase [SAR202 cluster bacterium]
MFPSQVFPETAKINAKGHLVIGGCDVTDLAAQHGTPLYVFDEATLRNRCRAFVSEFRKRYHNTLVCYASKAYINPALAKLFVEEGLGLDVVSGGEVAVAKAAGADPEKVFFHGNNKTRDELQYSIEWGIGRIVVDSFYELSLLDELAARAHKVQRILLRVSPGIDPHTHAKTTTGILDSKFGFSIATGDATKAVRQALNSKNLKLMGLHFHLGSPIFELEPYEVAMGVVLEYASGLREEGLDLKEISPGGGFAIAYLRSKIPPPIADYAKAITSSLSDGLKRFGFEPPQLIIEPGRSIVGPAGVAVYRVGAVKTIPGVRKYVSVDGGMGDNIRPALYEAQYEAVLANRVNDPPTEKVTVAGKYCESGDILLKDYPLPKIDTSGDLIAIPASGAYCPSMASNYNLNPKPPIVLVKDGKARLIRRRETYEDQMLLDRV